MPRVCGGGRAGWWGGVVSLRCGRRISSGSGELTDSEKHGEKQRGDPRVPPQARSRRPAGPSPAVDLWVRPSAAPSMSWLEYKPTRFSSQQSFLFITDPTMTPRPSPTPAVNTKDLRYHNRDHQIPAVSPVAVPTQHKTVIPDEPRGAFTRDALAVRAPGPVVQSRHALCASIKAAATCARRGSALRCASLHDIKPVTLSLTRTFK
jgi:hypothetical protein